MLSPVIMHRYILFALLCTCLYVGDYFLSGYKALPFSFSEYAVELSTMKMMLGLFTLLFSDKHLGSL